MGTTTTPQKFEQRRGYDYPVRVDAAQSALDDEAKRLRRAADLRFGGDRDGQLLNKCQLVAEACGDNPRTGEAYYTATDVLGWLARAVEMDCEAPRLGPIQIERLFRVELIPNALLRDRYEELKADGKISASKLAGKLGITKKASHQRGDANGRVPDASAVERMLGVIPTQEGGVQRMRLFVSYEQAVALADALDIPYHDLGV